jgi:hypothetical protein
VASSARWRGRGVTVDVVERAAYDHHATQVFNEGEDVARVRVAVGSPAPTESKTTPQDPTPPGRSVSNRPAAVKCAERRRVCRTFVSHRITAVAGKGLPLGLPPGRVRKAVPGAISLRAVRPSRRRQQLGRMGT